MFLGIVFSDIAGASENSKNNCNYYYYLKNQRKLVPVEIKPVGHNCKFMQNSLGLVEFGLIVVIPMQHKSEGDRRLKSTSHYITVKYINGHVASDVLTELNQLLSIIRQRHKGRISLRYMLLPITHSRC